MPIYEYECTGCGKVEEALQKFSDKPLKKCRHCSGKLHKIVSHSSFQLKGTGWYVTDYGGGRSRGTTSVADGKGSDETAGGSQETSPKKSNDEN